MTIVMHDLAGAERQRFSPYCWRTRMALAHKGLEVETRPVRFSDIADIGGGHKTVPVIEDGDNIVSDSWEIAEYLERAYPGNPSLFGSAQGRLYALFVNQWANSTLMPGISRAIIFDIHERLDDADKEYFRTSREARFGDKLENVQADRESRVKEFAATLAPLRASLTAAPYLGGDQPFYGDYAVFGPLQWARIMSPFELLAGDDTIQDWFNRCLDLYGGLGRAQEPAGPA